MGRPGCSSCCPKKEKDPPPCTSECDVCLYPCCDDYDGPDENVVPLGDKMFACVTRDNGLTHTCEETSGWGTYTNMQACLDDCPPMPFGGDYSTGSPAWGPAPHDPNPHDNPFLPPGEFALCPEGQTWVEADPLTGDGYCEDDGEPPEDPSDLVGPNPLIDPEQECIIDPPDEDALDECWPDGYKIGDFNEDCNCNASKFEYALLICNVNAAKDDEFDVCLNGYALGPLSELGIDKCQGKFFVTDESVIDAIKNPHCHADVQPRCCVTETSAHQVVDKLPFLFDEFWLQMQNTKENNNGNYGFVGIWRTHLDKNGETVLCALGETDYSGYTGSDIERTFGEQEICPYAEMPPLGTECDEEEPVYPGTDPPNDCCECPDADDCADEAGNPCEGDCLYEWRIEPFMTAHATGMKRGWEWKSGGCKSHYDTNNEPPTVQTGSPGPLSGTDVEDPAAKCDANLETGCKCWPPPPPSDPLAMEAGTEEYGTCKRCNAYWEPEEPLCEPECECTGDPPETVDDCGNTCVTCDGDEDTSEACLYEWYDCSLDPTYECAADEVHGEWVPIIDEGHFCCKSKVASLGGSGGPCDGGGAAMACQCWPPPYKGTYDPENPNSGRAYGYCSRCERDPEEPDEPVDPGETNTCIRDSDGDLLWPESGYCEWKWHCTPGTEHIILGSPQLGLFSACGHWELIDDKCAGNDPDSNCGCNKMRSFHLKNIANGLGGACNGAGAKCGMTFKTTAGCCDGGAEVDINTQEGHCPGFTIG